VSTPATLNYTAKTRSSGHIDLYLCRLECK